MERQFHCAFLESPGYECFVHVVAEGRRGPEDDHERNAGRVSRDEEVHGHLGTLDAEVGAISGRTRCHGHGITESLGPAGGELLKYSHGHLE